MIVHAGQFVAADAAFGHMDMMLWRQTSPELATLVAHYLIIDARPSHSAYIVSDHLAHSDESGIQLDAAARDLASSKRTLARRIREALGKTSVSYVQDLRIERAVHLLNTSSTSVDRIAVMVGVVRWRYVAHVTASPLGKGIREIKGVRQESEHG
jgi:AraC-like DNA-binding protein